MIEFWQLCALFICLIYLLTISLWEAGEGLVSPQWFYEEWRVNWFGAWFLFIGLRIISPLVTLIECVAFIVLGTKNFIKWLFTVGREDD